jgi:hypothetical protein
MCHEKWLKDDLAEAKSNSAPLWDGKVELRARTALPDERALFAVAKKKNGQPSDGLIVVFLVEVDGGVADEQPFDPRLSAGPILICRFDNSPLGKFPIVVAQWLCKSFCTLEAIDDPDQFGTRVSAAAFDGGLDQPAVVRSQLDRSFG